MSLTTRGWGSVGTFPSSSDTILRHCYHTLSFTYVNVCRAVQALPSFHHLNVFTFVSVMHVCV